MRTVCSIPLWLAVVCICPASPAAQPSANAAGKAGLSDAEIERDLRMRLGRGKIAADRFQGSVKGGVATLTGHTDVIQHKGVATRLAKSAGARRVDNQIRIGEAARRKAAENLDKHRRPGEGEREDPPVKRSQVTRPG